MAKHYEVIIYTASLSKYADPLMNILDPEKLCTSLLNRRLEDVILIDNSPNSYRLQTENALPISTWYDDPSDTELFDLLPLLIGLSKIDDVRIVLS